MEEMMNEDGYGSGSGGGHGHGCCCCCCPPRPKPKKEAWLQASSSNEQLILGEDLPQTVLMENIDSVKGVVLDTITGTITILRKGTYFVMAAPQVGNIKECRANFRCWLSLNGVAIQNTTSLLKLEDKDKDVLVTQTVIELNHGDKLNVIAAVDKDSSVILEAIPGVAPGEPDIPSISLTLHKI